jgi:hypothetical protein
MSPQGSFGRTTPSRSQRRRRPRSAPRSSVWSSLSSCSSLSWQPSTDTPSTRNTPPTNRMSSGSPSSMPRMLPRSSPLPLLPLTPSTETARGRAVHREDAAEVRGEAVLALEAAGEDLQGEVGAPGDHLGGRGGQLLGRGFLRFRAMAGTREGNKLFNTPTPPGMPLLCWVPIQEGGTGGRGTEEGGDNRSSKSSEGGGGAGQGGFRRATRAAEGGGERGR